MNLTFRNDIGEYKKYCTKFITSIGNGYYGGAAIDKLGEMEHEEYEREIRKEPSVVEHTRGDVANFVELHNRSGEPILIDMEAIQCVNGNAIRLWNDTSDIFVKESYDEIKRKLCVPK